MINKAIYQLQESGNRLADALRKIAGGCPNPEIVAQKALNFKAPEPKWDKLDHDTIPKSWRGEMGSNFID